MDSSATLVLNPMGVSAGHQGAEESLKASESGNIPGGANGRRFGGVRECSYYQQCLSWGSGKEGWGMIRNDGERYDWGDLSPLSGQPQRQATALHKLTGASKPTTGECTDWDVVVPFLHHHVPQQYSAARTRSMAKDTPHTPDGNARTPWKHMVDVPVEEVELRDEAAVATAVKKRQLLGAPGKLPEAQARVQPPREKFMYSEDDFCPWPAEFLAGLPTLLEPPPAEIPDKGTALPQSPVWKLVRDGQFTSGWVYEAHYCIRTQWNVDRDLQARVTSPASVKPVYDAATDKYELLPIAGMTHAKPGIPMVYRVTINEADDVQGAHTFTVACSQTLDSLKHYPDFPTILKLCNILAKHIWGTEDVTSISDLDMKLNDRTVTTRIINIKDGSFSLSMTVMKGEGQGTVLPASQTDTKSAREKITAVLRLLNELVALVLPKCISRFEWEMIRWHTRFNNVVQFGDHVIGPTSVQLNCSSIGKELAVILGKQGFWHPDPKDDFSRYTVFILFLNVGEYGDPGAFCLSRGGVYVRELNQWVVFIVFKGTDMHSGHTPSESRARFEERMNGEWDYIWQLAGEGNRRGLVCYPSAEATERKAGVNFSPPTFFGNLVPSHRDNALNLMQHAATAMGGPVPHARWVAREIVMQFWNSLQLANLDMAIDINDLMESLSTVINGKKIDMGSLPYHPINDREQIQEYMGYWAFYYDICEKMAIHNVRSRYKALDKARREDPSTKALGQAFRMAGNTRREMEGSIEGVDLDSIEVEQYVDRKEVVGSDMQAEVYFTLKLKGRDNPIDIPRSLLKARGDLYKRIKNMLPKPVEITNGKSHSDSTTAVAVSAHLYLPTASTFATTALTSPQPSHPHLPQPQLSPQPPDPSEPSQASPPNSTSAEGSRTTLTADCGAHKPTSRKRARSASVGESKSPPAKRKSTQSKSPQGQRHDLGPTRRSTSRTHARKQNTRNSALPACASGETARDSGDIEMAGGQERCGEPDDGFIEKGSYVVKRILNHRVDMNTGEVEYEVEWQDYDEPEWLAIPNLVGSMELVAEYRAERMANPVDATDMERMRYSQFLFDGTQYDISKSDKLWLGLSPAHLMSENEDLMALTLDRTLTAKKLKDISVYKAFGSFLENGSKHALLHDLMFMAPENAKLHTGLSQLQHAITASQHSEGIFLELTHFTIAAQASQWQLGRSLVFMYRWASEFQPTWLRQIKIQFAENGYQQLLGSSDEVRPLADIFRHTLWSVWTFVHKTSKRRKIVPPPPHKFGPSPSDVDELPDTLYGLRKTGAPLSLRQSRHRKHINQSRFLQQEEGDYSLYYDTAEMVVGSIIQYELIAPNLRQMDKRLSNTRHKKNEDLDHVWERTITRGAILYATSCALGTDAIFASRLAFEALTSPSFLNNDAIRNSKNYLYHISKDGVIAALADWLKARVDPETAKCAMTLGTTLHQFIRDSYDGSDKLASAASKPSDGRKCLFGPVSQEELIPGNGHNADYSTMGLILRETLNDLNGMPAAQEAVYRVLKGQHSLLASTIRYNPDHTNPVRHNNVSASLFKIHITPCQLTTRSGLACAIAWHVTGQGYHTQRWLSSISSFYSQTSAELLIKFERADDHNERLQSMSGARKDDILRSSDPRIYGQASNYLGLTPTRTGENGQKEKMSPLERLDQCFREDIEACWTNWLGEMYGQDPETWKGKRKSWTETWDMIVGLRIPGLGGGLAALQLTNTLSLSKVAEMPTIQEIADWVWRNPNKGAFKGLQMLGFDLPNTNAVRYAFKAIENHLRQFLSKEDQILLQLGPMFIEHLLCKVARYKTRLEKEGQTEEGKKLFLTLAKQALEATRNAPWLKVNTRKDPIAFPFPLTSDPSHVADAIESCHSHTTGRPANSIWVDSYSSEAGMSTLQELAHCASDAPRAENQEVDNTLNKDELEEDLEEEVEEFDIEGR
ncbi:hypothetical protein NMY22_g8116 [Coprinellus aureogranulatus]|nr:hypothetical protein NMY22_g8116 [Coprinellus aureogranulatus]